MDKLGIFKSNLGDIVLLQIPSGIILYRAIKNNYNNPYECLKPMKCNDTDKVGCYFSIGSSLLSDFMTLEYKSNLFLYSFVLKSNIVVVYGKYTESDIKSHLDDEVKPISFSYDFDKFKDEKPTFELFISEDLLRNTKIEFINVKEINVKSIRKKYKKYYYNTPDITMNELINFHNNYYENMRINKHILIYNNIRYIINDFHITCYRDDDNFLIMKIKCDMIDENNNKLIKKNHLIFDL